MVDSFELPGDLKKTSEFLRNKLNVQHIIFDWTLVEKGSTMVRKPSREEMGILWNLFPDTKAVHLRTPFLTIRVDTLPPRP